MKQRVAEALDAALRRAVADVATSCSDDRVSKDRTLSEDRELIDRLLTAWYQLSAPRIEPDPPEDMRVGEVDDNGWWEWRLVESTVTTADLDDLEDELGLTLPPFYRAFLLSRACLGLEFGDFGVYSLPSLPTTDPLAKVEDLLFSDLRPEAGYLQFGSARGCGDLLCFDTHSPDAEGDYPVVVIDHELIAPDSPREVMSYYAAIVAPSFRDFLPRLLREDPSLFPPPLNPAELARNNAAKK